MAMASPEPQTLLLGLRPIGARLAVAARSQTQLSASRCSGRRTRAGAALAEPAAHAVAKISLLARDAAAWLQALRRRETLHAWASDAVDIKAAIVVQQVQHQQMLLDDGEAESKTVTWF